MTILVIDDHPLIRSGIISSLKLEENIDFIIEASTVSEAIVMIQMNSPDISIVDICLGKENGLEIIERCRANKINTKFLVLTSSIKKDDFLKAQKLNVDGYVLKEAFVEDIIYAVNVLMRGKKYIDPEIMQYTINAQTPFTELSSRENDVLEELGKGLSNAEIAKNLFVTEHTVKKHISSILSKLELNNRTEIAIYAANHGKISYNA